jgi:hypothetical protein
VASSLATTSSLGGTANAVPGAYDAVTGPLFRLLFSFAERLDLKTYNLIPKHKDQCSWSF